ncbi:hypothetical protein COU37_02345 [Candidatus Micrarchaeota archaeon CG10_big_fil_rev_8_21_14_0_10_45_29]|nr:MAG: hypothetical protein COU37_02345 [Candidatus Micrarchaeota archaeon CG10_big_fil_rev_8_21_14_0_10_45_29]
MRKRALRHIINDLERRWVYLATRLIVLLTFGSILFFPEELKLALETPILLGIMLVGTIGMALILLGDLISTRQKNIASLMYKYVFLTVSVILAYGMFYYIDATILEPPGIEYFTKSEVHNLEMDVFYFSGVTYFTIGYGDVTPISTYAKSASITEAFAGSIINLVVLALAFQRFALNINSASRKK